DGRGGGSGIPFPGRGKKTDQNKKPTISLNGKITKQDGVKSTITVETDDSRNIELKITNETKIAGESGKLTAPDLGVGDEISIQPHTDDKGYFFADTIHVDESSQVHRVSGTKSSKGSAAEATSDGEDHRPILRRADDKAAENKPADTKAA